MARLDPDSAAEAFDTIDLGGLATRVAAELEPLAEAKRIALTLERIDRAVLRGQSQALYTLARNLVDNAIRYTPPGGSVGISALRQGDSVILQVDDSGPGIPAEERARVFDRFYRLPGTDPEGSGLAIVRQIAVAHGGDVELVDAESGGLRVRVRFPSARGDVDRGATPS